jgi:hypothetical protein
VKSFSLNLLRIARLFVPTTVAHPYRFLLRAGKTGTAYQKIIEYSKKLPLGTADEFAPGSDLKFVVHLVGDIHQPNHTATDQDRGANCLRIVFEDNVEKLHGVFDHGIIEAKINTDDRSLAGDLIAKFHARPAAEQQALLKMSASAENAVRSWILEAHELAVTRIYKPLTKPKKIPVLKFKEVKSDCSDAAKIFRSTV